MKKQRISKSSLATDLKMKVNINIDEEEMVTEIKEMVDNISKQLLPYVFLGAGLFVLLLILTSCCGSALAICCCKKCHFKRVRRRIFKLKTKTQITSKEDEGFI